MRCPQCNYISFDYLENCKKCGAVLAGIKSDLCPMETPPGEVSIWEWLGLGIKTDAVTVEPSTVPSKDGIELPPNFEISLNDQTEEVFIEEVPLVELEKSDTPAEIPEEPVIEESIDLSGVEKEITLEPVELSLSQPDSSVEATVQDVEIEFKEIPTIEPETELPVADEAASDIAEERRFSDLGTTPSSAKKEEDVDEINTLLKELDEILDDEGQ